MLNWSLVLVLAFSFVHPQRTVPMNARDYYNELYKAGGLDRMVEEYVCFDQDNPARTNFFLMARSEDIKKSLQAQGILDQLPKSMQHGLDGDFLMLRNYLNGVPEKEECSLEKDEES